ncbi:MAG TPA: hypothetical protein VFK05_24660 [Polyangiaceae bacterium]|nr:hypothetical protein [Polyangiaceae bacterium]
MRLLLGAAQLGTALIWASALLSACSTSSAGDARAASGSAGAAPDITTQGGMSSSAAAGDEGTAVEGGKPNGGSQSEGGDSAGTSGASSSTGDLGGAQNLYVTRIIVGEPGEAESCLPRPILAGLPGSATDGRIPCLIAELESGSCDCTQRARAPLPAPMLTASKKQLQIIQACDGTSGVSCDSFCGCQIVQAAGFASDPGSDLYACQNELTPDPSVGGYCVIDLLRTDENGAPAPLGSPDLVASCPSDQKRRLRFVGAAQPMSGELLFIGCTR